MNRPKPLCHVPKKKNHSSFPNIEELENSNSNLRTKNKIVNDEVKNMINAIRSLENDLKFKEETILKLQEELKKYEEKYPHPSQPTTSLLTDKSNQADFPHLLLPLSDSFESLLAREEDFKTETVMPVTWRLSSLREHLTGPESTGSAGREPAFSLSPPPSSHHRTHRDALKTDRHFPTHRGNHQTARADFQVLVTSLPHRHDLPPSSHIHDSVSLVNHYLEKLCVRYKGAELVDIRHKHFTQHGLHLRASGKILIADAIVRGLADMSLPRRPPAPAAPRVRTPPRGPEPAADCESPPTQDSPRTLPHDTFADAVKTNTAASPTRQTNSLQTNDINTFLGNPLSTMTQN
ncbi:hypothetical protein J6590_092049 [Homalodisca vitripennis]|nr:hypothetical protein J6590_092049 [Homalodisca vitripennis]